MVSPQVKKRAKAIPSRLIIGTDIGNRYQVGGRFKPLAKLPEPLTKIQSPQTSEGRSGGKGVVRPNLGNLLFFSPYRLLSVESRPAKSYFLH